MPENDYDPAYAGVVYFIEEFGQKAGYDIAVIEKAGDVATSVMANGELIHERPQIVAAAALQISQSLVLKEDWDRELEKIGFVAGVDQETVERAVRDVLNAFGLVTPHKPT